jgi:serpin B
MTKESVAIDDVLHKTFIRLDKKGTEAAAVTAVLMKASSAMPRPQMIKQVFLDRPFVCGIIDTKTGAPLFLGVVRGI